MEKDRIKILVEDLISHVENCMNHIEIPDDSNLYREFLEAKRKGDDFVESLESLNNKIDE